ncbi:MAG: Rab family GTPase [Candidatus Lokiarchaeia archaeon]|nr:Rab family GTPase [Candidatus Lokiarchaeia archaeon]
MGLLKNWRKRRRLGYVSVEFSSESLYQTVKTFNEDMPVSIKGSKRKYPKHEMVSSRKKLIYRAHFERIYDATYKIVLFGEAGAPKEQLVKKFLTNLFKLEARMTIGVDFEVKSLEIDNKRVKLQVWDFGGEERFKYLLPMYVRGANGALFLYDVNNYSSLAHIDDWLMIVKKEIQAEDEFPIIVVGIVSELENREVSSQEGLSIAKSSGVDGFIECSPRTGENVEETFEALTRLMLTHSGIGIMQ